MGAPMSKKRIDLLFICFSVVALLFFALGFHSFNSQKEIAEIDTAGTFSEWGVSSCDIKNGYVYVSGWASPKNAYKLKTELYLVDGKNHSNLKIKTLMYQRGNENEEMKAHRYFDNSGFVSALRIPMGNSDMSHKIAIVSLGSDGKWYRGDYVCAE